MKKKTILFLIILSTFATMVSAQGCHLPGNTAPRETSFAIDSILFSEFLSEFSVRCQQYDTLHQWFNRMRYTHQVPLDSKYEKILVSVPFFHAYPAFRIDCPNGYILGIYNVYSYYGSSISHLDILSFNLHGNMTSRCSWAEFGVGKYYLDDKKTVCDSQVISSTEVANGEIRYSFTQSSYIDGEATSVESSVYRYKIQDDATLKLLSVEPRLDF